MRVPFSAMCRRQRTYFQSPEHLSAIQVKSLCNNAPKIHVDITIQHPKLSFKNDPALIKAVYPHVFIIEEYRSGTPQCHTLQYTDILTRQIRILELDENGAH